MKNRTTVGAKLGFAMLPLCLALLPGCGAAVEDENETEPGEAAQDIELPTDPVKSPNPPDLEALTGTCWMKKPDAVLTRIGEGSGSNRAGGSVGTPTKYGTKYCAKSWVTELQPNPVQAPQGDMNRVQWADPWKRTRSQCLGATLKLSVYSSAFDFKRGISTDLPPRFEGSLEAPLIWDDTNQECIYSYFNVFQRPADGTRAAYWVMDTMRMTHDQGNVEVEKLTIRNYNGRSLRLVASALAPGGNSTQPLWISAN